MTIDSINSVNKIIIIDSIVIKETKFSVENLNNYLKSKNINDPSYIISQLSLESGEFKSNLFIKYNNICGMKYSKRNSIGKTKGGYAIYKHWTNSVDVFLLWLKNHSLNSNDSKYIYKLKSKHYNNSNGYVNLILKRHKYVIKKYNNIFNKVDN